ncbi:dihydrofolate reductase family protein [Allostreptomyces psammosilenae]|uniref:dihydrofolate reductase family protein n=1 Tax=Allostreptomyces psammosilenae TaxID=1892865 RepID=UPI0015CA9AAF|nr:dihydrofolate reductase family protein [Allostreptomyces psammosilenae]
MAPEAAPAPAPGAEAGRRPYVLLSCAASVDGYIDDSTATRLLLSNDADFDRVDAVRAECDAILVGARTIRRDDPRLLVRSDRRRAERVARGLPASPAKVTLTLRGELDPRARFFAEDAPEGPTEKVVYAATSGAEVARRRLGPGRHTTVVDAGEPLSLRAVLADLAARGVRRLMVEGGSGIHTRFLAEGLADEVRLAVAPFFVGDPGAPRFVGPGPFPHDSTHRMLLAGVEHLGDVVVPRYLLGAGSPAEVDARWLREAVELARRCPPSSTAFSVGAVVVAVDGTVLATGYSREGGDDRVHAEEAALAKVAPGDPRLAGATLYSSLEPCSVRKSRPRSCSRLILDAGIRRVVYAWREPVLFVDGAGDEELTAAGVRVRRIEELSALAMEPNAHLVGGPSR